jgi:hypothetical protein
MTPLVDSITPPRRLLPSNDGNPAVFIWNPQGIREDLGGSQAVREAFDKSKQMARGAVSAGSS